MVALLVAVSATLIGIQYKRGRDAALASAAEEMRTFSGRLVDRFRILFGDTTVAIGLASVSDIFLEPPPERLGAKIGFLRKAVETSSNIDGAYAGYPDGSFVHIVRIGDDDRWRRALRAPENVRTAIRIIEVGTDGERLSRWRFLDAAGRTLSEGTSSPAEYDPRTRPWYTAVAGRSMPVATAPYTMATTGSLAVTIAEAHQTRPDIVIGIDILLDAISRFLAEERVSPGGRAFIVDADGSLVIHSDPAVMSMITAPMSERAGSAVEPDEIAARIQAAPVRDGDATFVMADGSTYLMLSTSIDVMPLLQGDRIVVAAPLDELTADAERALRQNLGFSALILAAGVASALLFSYRITRALQALTVQVQHLSDLDFSAPIELRSHVQEISALAGAMAMARGAIHTFGLYVPKELVRRIVEAGQFQERSALRQEVTAMFTDIYDFTTISEQRPPEDIVSMLSAYFEIFSRLVAEHNGAIIQFLGDSVFAMWNAPTADPRHAESACRCALALRESIDAFNREQASRGLPEFRTRYGIHTGPAVVGSVGASERLQYTGMGDTLNVASRLEGLNKTYRTEILVSGAVVAQCPPDLAFRPLGAAEAKGRTQSIELFELVGVRQGSTADAGAPAAGRAS